VIAVDSSLGAIDVAKKNAAHNKHNNIEFIKRDVFEYLKKCDLKFDFIHLDPPSFVKTRKLITPALKGYKKLLLDALKLIKNDGSIMVSSCSHHISERMLQEVVEESIKEAGFNGKKIFFGIQDKDHPLLSGFAEALYLKAVVFNIASK
jgi:23S rRNA (cytosine1962-C5)-methyltransferase